MPFVIQPPVSNIIKTVTNPGAGNDFGFVQPANIISRLIALTVVFATDGTGANRTPMIIIGDGTDELVHAIVSKDVVASKIWTIDWNILGTLYENPTSSQQTIPIPDHIWIYPGYTIDSSTNNIQAGDTYTNVRIWFHQYLTSVTA